LYCWLPQLVETSDHPERVSPRKDAENTSLGKQRTKSESTKQRQAGCPTRQTEIRKRDDLPRL
jgi:hypothetical protein